MCTSGFAAGEPDPGLSSEQRLFLSTALAAWAGAASLRPRPAWPLRDPTRTEFDVDVVRLRARLTGDEPRLSTRDWTLILVLAEEALTTDLLGAAVGSGFVSAWTVPEARTLLRSVQQALEDHVDRSLMHGWP